MRFTFEEDFHKPHLSRRKSDPGLMMDLSPGFGSPGGSHGAGKSNPYANIEDGISNILG